MALMFPRLARNFIKAGYFPTDEPTLERALSALAPDSGNLCILDPCAGEGVAIADRPKCLRWNTTVNGRNTPAHWLTAAFMAI